MSIRLLSFLCCLSLSACVGEYIPGEPDGIGGGGGTAGSNGTNGTGGTGGGGPVTFSADIQPVFQSACSLGACHGAANETNGNYGTATYADVLGPGSDEVANVIANDATSFTLLQINENHFNVLASNPGLDEMVRAWIVDNAAAQ